ncbi:MAG: thioredoxin-disulfide reductase [Chloroflexota bacterium]|nr:thioredoxin-disulfide reductase [Chloroflexota bacterium]
MAFEPKIAHLESEDAGKAAERYELVIIGGGPAGLTAAIYAGRARIATRVCTGILPGGQPNNTAEVDNFPGFPDGVDGGELARRFQSQAERFGAEIVPETVTGVDFSERPFTIQTDRNTCRAQTVIVATGAAYRRLGIPGEDKFYGRGVSSCATCDGFFYQDKQVVVIGGGDTAMNEALFLTKFAEKVTVIHRRSELRATKILQERAFANPKIDFLWDSVVEEVLGDQTVTGVRVRNVKTGETSMVKTDGVFVYIGMEPKSSLFVDQLELDDNGYIVSNQRQHTSVPGVFAAGDVQDPRYRQVVTAAGTGAIAALEAERYLGDHPGQ